ncbi:mobile mystery protein A [Dyadobacter sp. 32]|uniref:mobile mystery protein A n=1 Tax=Dyadobacter sp. 32 TaxID=538966 RepID=UPI0011F0599D
MKLTNSQLIVIRQLDQKMQDLTALAKIPLPAEGWISLLRKALNMSLRQLGVRLSMTAQGIKDIEKREADGTITLKSLIEAGDALNMKFVYGFAPKDGSLEDMIESKAREQALKIVKRTSTTMKLEDQENSPERLKQAVDELSQEIKREMPRSLWD